MKRETKRSGCQQWLAGRVISLCLVLVMAGAAAAARGDGDCDLARKADIMHGPQWQRAVAELGDWLSTQTVYTPAEVQRIKVRFNERVAGMSSYELEYLIDSIDGKMRLLGTPQARDAKAWLGEYLSAMSDARRAAELSKVPDLLDMNAAQLWEEIQRIDRKRASLQQRQQGVAARQESLAESARANRQASAQAAAATAARLRSVSYAARLARATPAAQTRNAGFARASSPGHIEMKAPIGPTPIDIRRGGTSEKGGEPPCGR